MKHLFENLLWPAAAGNVGWSLAYLAIEKGIETEDVLPRLVALALLFTYLADEWWRLKDACIVGYRYWVADGLLIAGIVTFAVATQLGEAWLQAALSIVFVIAIGGHLLGFWLLNNEPYSKAQPLLAATNALGLVTMFGLVWLLPQSYPWNLPAAIFVVLVTWFAVTSWLKWRVVANETCTLTLKPETSGIFLNPVLKKVLVIKVTPAVPGQDCSLMVNDEILQVNDQKIEGQRANAVMGYWKGLAKGESCILEVRRAGSAMNITIK